MSEYLNTNCNACSNRKKIYHLTDFKPMYVETYFDSVVAMASLAKMKLKQSSKETTK
jgi:hypothetical protein